MRGDDWFLPKDGGLSFGGGGRGPVRPCGGTGLWLAKTTILFVSALYCDIHGHREETVALHEQSSKMCDVQRQRAAITSRFDTI